MLDPTKRGHPMSKCYSPLGLQESDDLAVEQKQNELISLVAQFSKSQYYVIFLFLNIFKYITNIFKVYSV